MKTNKRAQNLTAYKLIIILLVLIVIVIVIAGMYWQNILNWMKNLPGYQPPKDEFIDASQLTDEMIKNFCQVRVGYFGYSENKEFTGIWAEMFGIKQYYIFLKEGDDFRQTTLYISPDEKYVKVAPGNKVAGQIADRTISITDFSLYSRNELEAIDEARLEDSNNLCKKELK